MKKYLLAIGLFFIFITFGVTGCGKGACSNIKTMAEYTNIEEFQTVPYMETKGNYLSVDDYGNKDYVLHITETNVKEYQAYLKTIETAGFKKHSDNGEEGMEGYAYSASYTKGKLTLTVSHAVKLGYTYISASYDLPLSDHLVYKDQYVEGADKKPATKLHMMQMMGSAGCAFIYELKNGHFVIYDGGSAEDAKHLLQTLNDLTPGDEKPVIEAWFLSHCHGDHHGALLSITQDPTMVKQIYVNGFYYVEPSKKLFDRLTTQSNESGNRIVTRAYRMFQTESGGTPEFYRPKLGQRYYFCDIMIDVAMTLEQIPYNQYRGTDFNDTSTWLMTHVDGQKILFGGDASKDATRMATLLYDETYLSMDIFLPFHHGINVYDELTQLCTYDVVLYPAFRPGSIWDTRDDLAAVGPNNRLQEKAKEVFHHGDGSITLTFPYQIGTAEVGEDWQDLYRPL